MFFFCFSFLLLFVLFFCLRFELLFVLFHCFINRLLRSCWLDLLEFWFLWFWKSIVFLFRLSYLDWCLFILLLLNNLLFIVSILHFFNINNFCIISIRLSLTDIILDLFILIFLYLNLRFDLIFFKILLRLLCPFTGMIILFKYQVSKLLDKVWLIQKEIDHHPWEEENQRKLFQPPDKCHCYCYSSHNLNKRYCKNLSQM